MPLAIVLLGQATNDCRGKGRSAVLERIYGFETETRMEEKNPPCVINVSCVEWPVAEYQKDSGSCELIDLLEAKSRSVCPGEGCSSVPLPPPISATTTPRSTS